MLFSSDEDLDYEIQKVFLADLKEHDDKYVSWLIINMLPSQQLISFVLLKLF